jgi:cyclase
MPAIRSRQARAYDAAGADELCFLDITASHEARGTLLDVVSRTAEACFMPLTVGGGVRTPEDARALLLAGADKVAINSAAVAVRNWSRTWPIASAPVRRRAVDAKPGRRPLGNLHPWRPTRHRHRRGRHAVNLVRLGAGELLVTSMDRDGTKGGYDLA